MTPPTHQRIAYEIHSLDSTNLWVNSERLSNFNRGNLSRRMCPVDLFQG